MTVAARRFAGRVFAYGLFAIVALASAAAPSTAGVPDDAVALAEFVAGGPLDGRTRERLSRLAEDQARGREGGAALEKRLREVVAGLRALPDDAARAEVRRKIVTELYWKKDAGPDPVAALTLDRASVVAADAETRAVVRRADLAGFCASAALAAEILGRAFDRSACLVAAEKVAASISSLAPDDRELLAFGERRAAVLAAFWQELPEPRRARVVEVVRTQGAALDPGRIGRSLETAAISARLARRLERFNEAANRGLVDGAVASAVAGAAHGM